MNNDSDEGNNRTRKNRQLTYKIIYSYKRTLYTSTYCLRHSRQDYIPIRYKIDYSLVSSIITYCNTRQTTMDYTRNVEIKTVIIAYEHHAVDFPYIHKRKK